MKGIHRLQSAFLATRPWTFSLTVVSVTLASVTAFQSGQFFWGRYALLLLATLLAHGAANILNDYGDVRHTRWMWPAPLRRPIGGIQFWQAILRHKPCSK